jgi:hypothetical protein
MRAAILFGRSLEGNIWRFRSDLPHVMCAELEAFCKAEPASISEHPKFESEYLEVLSKHLPIEETWAVPA